MSDGIFQGLGRPTTGENRLSTSEPTPAFRARLKSTSEVYESSQNHTMLLSVNPLDFSPLTPERSKVVNMWKYEIWPDREPTPAQTLFRAGWSAYVEASMPLLSALENRSWSPRPFPPEMKKIAAKANERS